jgi:hypothetical protein
MVTGTLPHRNRDSLELLDLTLQTQAAMPTTPSDSALPVGLLATAKVLGTVRTTESAEFQAVKAERQETSEIYRRGKAPESRMLLLIEAKGYRNDKGKAPQKRHEGEFAQPSVLGPLNCEVGHEI